jgi:RNA polymerase sigma factor (sigma-70 family)
MFEDNPQLEAEVEKLPEPQRTIILLFYSGEFTWKAIADLFGMKEEQAKKIHDQALRKLWIKLYKKF